MRSIKRAAPHALVALLLILFAAETALAQTISVTADLDNRKQTLRGFGATLIPLVYGGIDYLSASERSKALTAAIDSVGITTGNLSTTVEQGANDNVNPFTTNPDGFDFSVTQDAVAAIVIPGEPLGLTGWYPGSRIDQRFNHAWMKALRDLDYDNYLDEVAENVVQQLIWWRDEYGYIPTLLQLFNEPTTGNKELRGVDSAQEVVDIIKRAGARISAAGFESTYFIVPNEETVSSSLSTAQLIFDDPDARKYVGAIGYHPYPYGSSYASPARILLESGSGNPNSTEVYNRQLLRALADQFEAVLGREIQTLMTEVSEGPGNNDFPFGSMEELRARAIHIHDEILYAGASAYYGVHLLWDQRSHFEHFNEQCEYRDEESAIVLIDGYDCNGDGDTGTITINPIGYAIGHFARWAPPGSVVVQTTTTDPTIQVTGFHDIIGERLALVFINNRPNTVSVETRLVGASVSGDALGEASYADARWVPLPAVVTSPDLMMLNLPPYSVTSIGVPIGRDTSIASGHRPLAPSLHAPFPNPSSGSATASYVLAQGGHVRLEVVDVLGRTVVVLADGVQPDGSHSYHIPSGLSPGHYILRLRTPDGDQNVTLTIVK